MRNCFLSKKGYFTAISFLRLGSDYGTINFVCPTSIVQGKESLYTGELMRQQKNLVMLGCRVEFV